MTLNKFREYDPFYRDDRLHKFWGKLEEIWI